jgi:hypothetical protein
MRLRFARLLAVLVGGAGTADSPSGGMLARHC